MTWGSKWRHAPEACAEDFGGFEKSQLVESCRPKKKGDFCLLAEALCRARTWLGADGKVNIERWYLSPYVEKPLNSKVIKSFVLKLRSRKCILFFGIPMLSIYELWTFYVHSHIRVRVCYKMDKWKYNILNFILINVMQLEKLFETILISIEYFTKILMASIIVRK